MKNKLKIDKVSKSEYLRQATTWRKSGSVDGN